jgi:hypothetical protein
MAWSECRLRLKCDGTYKDARFHLPAKRTSPFKPAGASVQSTTGSRGVRISGSKAGYTMFQGTMKGTGYPLHSPVFPSFPLSCIACAITFQLDSTECVKLPDAVSECRLFRATQCLSIAVIEPIINKMCLNFSGVFEWKL